MNGKKKTRFAALLLAAIMLTGILSIQAYAEDPPKIVQVGLQQNITGGKLYGRDGLVVWDKIRDYTVGATVAIIAEPEEGWRLKTLAARWQPDLPFVSEEISIWQGIGEYLFEVPNGSVNVGATFERVYPVHVTVSGEGTASSEVKNAGKDDAVKITATPDQDWYFVRWSSADSSIVFENAESASTKFTMPERETTVEALFRKKPEASVLVPPAAVTGLTYDANAHKLVTAGTTDAGAMEYKLFDEDDSAWRTQIPTAVNAGTYLVQYRAGRDETHSLQTEAAGSVTVTIEKGKIQPTVTLEGWTYEDDSEHIPTVTGNEGNAKPIITYKEKDAEEGAYTDEQPVNAGVYNIRVQIPETDNYLSEEAVSEFTIAQKEIGINRMGAVASAITYGQRLKESTLTAEHPDVVEVSWKQPDTVPDAKTYAYGIQPAVIETLKQNYKLPDGINISVPLTVYPAVPDMTVKIKRDANGKTATLTAAVKKAGAGSVPSGSVVFYCWNDTENEWRQIRGTVATESTADSLIATLSGWDDSGLKNEDYRIKASYDGSDKNYSAAEKTITVRLTGITLDSKNAKTEYTEGDALDVSGLTLTAKYSDGSEKKVDVTASMVSGFDSGKIGKQTVTVTYEDCTATYEIEVKAKAAVSYAAKDGSGNAIQSVTWQKGSGKRLNLTFCRSEDDHLTHGLFGSLEIGGSTVDGANYDAAEGSLKLSIKPEYLETLSVGDHTVKVNFSDGSSMVKLTVKAAADPNVPRTADESNPTLWSGLMLLSAAMLVLLPIARKRKTER